MAKDKQTNKEPERLVTVYEVVECPNGSKRIGNSVEVTVSDAIQGTREDRYKAIDKARGVVPSEWEGGAGEAVNEAAVEAEEANGGDSDGRRSDSGN